MKSQVRFVQYIFGFLCIAGLCIIGFGNSLHNDFVYDDSAYVKNNPHIRSVTFFPLYFTSLNTYQTAGPEGQFKVYRPLVTASFMLDYLIGGMNPFGFHLTNMILHFFAGFLTYILVLLVVRGNTGIPLMTALIFLVHPVQVEAVTWISGRGNMLYAVFSLLCTIYFFLFLENRRIIHYCLSLLFFCMALFSKEMAINTIPLLILMYLYKEKISLKRILRIFFPLVVVAIAYCIMRYVVIGRMSQMSWWGTGICSTFLTVITVVPRYIWLLVCPVHLTVLPKVRVIYSILDPVFLISFFLIGVLLFFLIRKARSQASFGIWWVLISLTPVLNVIPLQALYAERFLYIGVIGFGLLIGTIFTHYKCKKMMILLLGFLMILSFRSIVRNADWKDNFSLWMSALRVDPYNAKAHNGLGVEFLNRNEVNGALSEFQTAVALSPHTVYFENNLALALRKAGKSEEAKRILEKALSSPENKAVAYHNLGLYYIESKEYRKALQYIRKALEYDPRYANAYNSLGVCYSYIGDENDTIKAWLTAHELMPSWYEPYYNIIVFYKKKGNKVQVAHYLQQASVLYPHERIFNVLNEKKF